MNMKYIDAIRNINGHDISEQIRLEYRVAKNFRGDANLRWQIVHSILVTLMYTGAIDRVVYIALRDYYRPWFNKIYSEYLSDCGNYGEVK